MKTAKYTRIVVRIAAREHITLRTAVELYRTAKFFGVRNLSRGLRGRVRRVVAIERCAP